MRGWMLVVVVALTGGCDDEIFNSTGGSSGYDADFVGVTALMHDHCVECHPALVPTFSVDVLVDDVADGTENFVVCGDPDSSTFYQRLREDSGLPIMPPAGALPNDAQESVRLWIADGCPLPGSLEGGE